MSDTIDLPADMPPVQQIQMVTVDPTKCNLVFVRVAEDHASPYNLESVRKYLEEELKPLGINSVIAVHEAVTFEFAVQEDASHTVLLKRVLQPEAWEHGLKEEIEQAVQEHNDG